MFIYKYSVNCAVTDFVLKDKSIRWIRKVPVKFYISESCIRYKVPRSSWGCLNYRNRKKDGECGSIYTSCNIYIFYVPVNALFSELKDSVKPDYYNILNLDTSWYMYTHESSQTHSYY